MRHRLLLSWGLARRCCVPAGDVRLEPGEHYVGMRRQVRSWVLRCHDSADDEHLQRSVPTRHVRVIDWQHEPRLRRALRCGSL